MTNLNGKRALVTGGSRGIGAAIALTLAEHGADVAITYQNSGERADSVISSIDKLGRRGFAIQADSADVDAIKRAVDDTVEARVASIFWSTARQSDWTALSRISISRSFK